MAAHEPRPIYKSGDWEIDLARRELRLRGIPIAVGGRAFEIVEVLVESASELVTKDDLIKRVWRGAIVEENVLQVHISAVRKSLGPHRDMLRTVSGRGYRLLGTWVIRRDKPSGADNLALMPDQHPVAAARSNLPVSTSSLIGRAAVVRQLLDLTSAYRTVTLTGPGGIGKTSLVLEVARYLLPAFQGDAWLVELASLSDPALVPSAIARVIGQRQGGAEISAESVARAIGDRKLLLVVDNCEHLIDATAQLVETIVRMCPCVSVLATSREVLRMEGEYVFRVPPLDVPPQDLDEPQSVLRHSATQLFIARLTALNSEFVLNGDDTSATARICRQLDGIPLAIEFAAARAATLGLQEVARRLDDRFGLLTGGRRTALPRHQTLRAALDWSYELLPASEQQLLRHLAVFAGGFTMEAATVVAGNRASAATLESIANLVGKSLVTLEGSVQSGRWRLLDTIRAYALDKLGENGEAEQAARQHAEFFRDLVAPAIFNTQLSLDEFDRFGREIDNIRAALDWTFSPSGDPAVGVVLAAAYAPVFLHLTLMVECRDSTERALQRLGPVSELTPSGRMQLLIALGVALVFTMGAVERIRVVLAEALALAETVGGADARLRTFWALWTLHFNIGECHAAQATAERFLRAARGADDGAVVHVAERLMGNTLQYGGRQREARQYFERVLERYVAPKDQRHFAWFHYDQGVLARTMLARTLWLQGHVDQAIEQAEAGLSEARAGHELSLLYPLAWALFPIKLMTGDISGAEGCLNRLTNLGGRYNAAFWKILARCLEAKLLIKSGEFSAGAAALRTALEACDSNGWTICYPEFLGALAEGLVGLGQLRDALITIDRGIAWADRGGERWYVSELLRCKGEMLLQESGGQSFSASEGCFIEALDLAREQGALFWELRGAISLARLRVVQHRHAEAQLVLRPVYERFTEGFETSDLRSAAVMLESLSTI
jgi:predicted ATPase/DNA-binding winged helix-turn-helix (wHTH) protein